MAGDKVRVAFIGAGGNNRGHMRGVAATEAAELVGVYDVDRTRAEECGKEYSMPAFESVEAMLDRTKPDAAYISIPPFAHGAPEEAVIERGVHFFVEKPVTLSMNLAHQIHDGAKKAGLITCVGYQIRYSASAVATRKFLSDRKIGMVSGHYWGGTPGAPWWSVMAESGGQMVEQATHAVDLIRFVAGDVKTVYARYNRAAPGGPRADVPDAYVVALEFANGAVGYVTSTCMLNKGGGSGGTNLHFFCPDLLVHWTHGGVEVFPESAGPIEGLDAPMPSIDQLFIEAVQTKDESKIVTNYYEGMKSLEVTLAANESAQTGRPVVLS